MIIIHHGGQVESEGKFPEDPLCFDQIETTLRR